MNPIIKKLDSLQGICLILIIMLSPVLIYSCGTILYQISAERTPHKHWYSFTLDGKHWELTPADTSDERYDADAWVTPTPIILTWTHRAEHYVQLHEIRHPITLLTLGKHHIQHIRQVQPAKNYLTEVHTKYVVILPGNLPRKYTRKPFNLFRQHVDIWDY